MSEMYTERNDNIVRMYESGMSAAKVGKHHDLAPTSVIKILHRRGVKMRAAKVVWEPNGVIIEHIRAAYHQTGPDHMISEIINRAGYSRSTCKRYLEHLGLKWTTIGDRHEARKAYIQAHPEMSAREIAEHLGMNRHAVRNYRRLYRKQAAS